MPVINFVHPLMNRPLSVETGADSFQWSYETKTATFPTYGGEVVQILGVFIDNLTIHGTVRSYAEMETIYGWFVEYIELATQGNGPDPSYSEEPVVMFYPERGWRMTIQPISVPGFHLSSDTVAPQWQIQAAVYEADPEITKLTLEKAVQGITDLNANIGFDEDNPFSDPKAQDRRNKNKALAAIGQDVLDPIAKFFVSGYDELLAGDVTGLLGEVSKAVTQGGSSGQDKPKANKP